MKWSLIKAGHSKQLIWAIQQNAYRGALCPCNVVVKWLYCSTLTMAVIAWSKLAWLKRRTVEREQRKRGAYIVRVGCPVLEGCLVQFQSPRQSLTARASVVSCTSRRYCESQLMFSIYCQNCSQVVVRICWSIQKLCINMIGDRHWKTVLHSTSNWLLLFVSCSSNKKPVRWNWMC